MGAAKSGSTALLNYVGQHPEVCLCARKEVHYFGSDLTQRNKDWTREEYLALFSHCGDAPLIGEKSVWYLYSRLAAGEIAEFSPEARVVVILRNPVEMIHSLHQHFVYMTREPVGEFERALELDRAREAGELPRAFEPRSYRSAASYAEQVERYLDCFGRDRVCILLYEDLIADPHGQYRRLCENLGIDAGFEPDFSVVNASRAPRSKVLNRLVRRPPEPVRRAGRALTTQPMRERLFLAALRLNRIRSHRGEMSIGCRDRLRAEFKPEIERLGTLIDRDLSGWLSTNPSAERVYGAV